MRVTVRELPGRGKGLVPFRTFDAAFRARCVNRDLSHVLDDTDPNYRPQRTADVMMDDPEGVMKLKLHAPEKTRNKEREGGVSISHMARFWLTETEVLLLEPSQMNT